LQCVILAGGLATRMWPLTQTIPKSLLPVGERPFVHHQLDWLAKTGVDEVVFCIGHMGNHIREYVGNGENWGVRVTYVDEGTNLRGTAGALRLALDQGVLREKFLVTYGDSYLPIDFREVWESYLSSGREALMTVFRNEGKWDTSNVAFEAGQILLYDKKKTPAFGISFDYIDYGLLAMGRDLLDKKVGQDEKKDLAELFEAISREGKLAGFEVRNRFYEVGSPQGLEDLTQYLAQNPVSEISWKEKKSHSPSSAVLPPGLS
jgi:NDP-sugar pyrophosphorylase family protein